MHIVVISTSYPAYEGDPSGHFVAEEARLLADEGHRVTVLCPGPRERSVREARTVEVLRLGAEPLFAWPGALARLRERPDRIVHAVAFLVVALRTLRSLGQVDRLIAHWLIPSGYAAAWGSSRPLEVVAHGSDVRLLCHMPRLVRRHVLGKLNARRATLRFVSEQLRAELDADLKGLNQLRIRVAPSPIDVSRTPAKLDARRALALDDAKAFAVVVGRLVPSKRVAIALAALGLVPNLQVVVVGDGPERESLATRFPSVRFVGYLPRPAALRWLSAADLVVSASRLEGAPTAIREALSFRTPVVACLCGDLDAWAKLDPLLWTVR